MRRCRYCAPLSRNTKNKYSRKRTTSCVKHYKSAACNATAKNTEKTKIPRDNPTRDWESITGRTTAYHSPVKSVGATSLGASGCKTAASSFLRSCCSLDRRGAKTPGTATSPFVAHPNDDLDYRIIVRLLRYWRTYSVFYSLVAYLD